MYIYGMPKVQISNLQTLEIPGELKSISLDIASQGGEAYLVGGVVRDTLLGMASKDYDLEVYGLQESDLKKILGKYGRPNLVGRAFGVYTMMIENCICDFAFPRRETKVAAGHKGFDVFPDPNLSFDEAALRRDFTINAMGLHLPDLKLIDPHGGLGDLQNGLLKHVSDAFSEDPLRALRAVQFAARMELDIHPDTVKICSLQPLDELPPERIFEEFKKLLLKSRKPSIGLEWMDKMDLLRFFPELKALKGVQQDPEWHPEGDVWVHNNMVIDEAARVRDIELAKVENDSDFDKTVLMFSALCHDFGKPATTIKKDGRWRSPAHDVAGDKFTRKFLARMTRDIKLIEQTVAYVREHLKPALLYNARHEVKQSAIRRLSLKVDITGLVRVAKADHFGRTTPDALAREFPAGEWLLEQSRLLNVLDETPKPYLTGKMLLKMGMEPGKHIGDLIKESFEEQLEGRLESEDQAREWARQKLNL